MITNKILIHHIGKPGDAGIDGIDGVDLTNVSLSRVDNPCVSLFKNNAIVDVMSESLVITRTDSSFYLDMYDSGHWVNGETLTNYAIRSTTGSLWSDFDFSWNVQGSGNLDPDGGNLAFNFQLDKNTALGGERVFGIPLDSVPTDKNLTAQFWIKQTSGIVQSIDVSLGDISGVEITDRRVVNNGGLTGDWQFFSTTFSSMSAAPEFLFINVRGSSGDTMSVTFVSLSATNSAIQRIDTSGAIQAASNISNETRLNNNGLMIERASNNQCLDSQDFNGDSWTFTTGSPTISKSLSPAPDGFIGDNIVITATGTDTITLRMTNALLVGSSDYVISMYANQLSGSGSLSCNIDGGTEELFNDVAGNNNYNRIFANVTSSSGGFIEIIIALPANGFQLSLWGIQAELDSMTSYIRNGDNEVGRGVEVVKIPFKQNAPQLDLDWSITWSQEYVKPPVTGVFNTVYDSLGTGSDAWNAKYSDSTDDLIVTNGTMSLSVPNGRGAKCVSVTFDKTSLKVYLDGVFALLTASGSPSTFVGNYIHLGGNATGNDLNTELQNFNIYDIELNSSDVLYLSEVISGS